LATKAVALWVAHCCQLSIPCKIHNYPKKLQQNTVVVL